MTKKEFEEIAMRDGKEISQELYRRIENLYMKTEETKWNFIERVYGKGNYECQIHDKTLREEYQHVKFEKAKEIGKGKKELERISRKKEDFLGVRMTKIEKEIIKHFARAEGLTASDFVRRVAIEYIARRAMCLKGEEA